MANWRSQLQRAISSRIGVPDMRMRECVARLWAVVVMLLAVPCGAVGQGLRVPDNDDILARTINSDSPYFLDRLMGKYFAWQQPLSDEEMYYLYYGYAFSDLYKPLEPIVAEDGVLAVVEEIMAEPTEERMHRLVERGLEVMERDPFSPKNLNFLAFAYGSLGDTINERRCFERLEGVLRTIEQSGTGTKESSPMHILWFSHAADVLYARGVDIKSREVVSRTCEYIFLRERDERGNLGYYFDFSRVYWVRSENEMKPEKRGWTINNLPLK